MVLSRVLAVVVGIAVGALAGTAVPSLFSELERRTYDSLGRFAESPTRASAAVVVAIDERSLAAHGRWPWNRSLLAQLVNRLGVLGARVVVVDVLLSEAADDVEDAALAAALTRAPTVAAYAFMFEPRPDQQGACVPPSPPLAERLVTDDEPLLGLPVASSVMCSLPLFMRSARAAGFVNAVADRDGMMRRSLLLISQNGVVYPSLPLAAAQLAAGGAALVIEQRVDDSLELRVGSRRFVLDRRGQLLLPVSGERSRPPQVSAVDVLARRVSADDISGRSVIVGPTAVGLGDVALTARDGQLAGVELHAEVLDTLLGGSGVAVERPLFPELYELLAAAFALIGMVVAIRRRGQRWSTVAAALASAGAWIGSGLLLRATGLYVSPLHTIVALTASVVAVTGYGTLHERRRRLAAQRLIIETLTSITEARNYETGRHVRRTATYARLLASALATRSSHRQQLTPKRVELISALAPLHDIGKVAIPDALLNKSTALTERERAVMQRHPALGHESLVKAEARAGVHDNEVLKLAKEIVHTHHERWDGQGYPSGLRGPTIPLAGRIVAVVDVYDALVAERPYRPAMPHVEAVDFIRRARGTHFDPDVVDAFLSVEAEFRVLAERSRTTSLQSLGR